LIVVATPPRDGIFYRRRFNNELAARQPQRTNSDPAHSIDQKLGRNQAVWKPRKDARSLSVRRVAGLPEASSKQTTEGCLAAAMSQSPASAARHIRRPDDVEAGFQRHVADR
jgi:hypothetical protein